MEHPSIDVYRRLTAAFMAQDAAAAEQVLAPDVRWHEAGDPQVIEGREAVMQRFSSLLGESIEPDIETHDIVASDDHLLALLNVRMSKPEGPSVRYSVVEIYHVADGQITERWAFMDACPDDVTAFFATAG